MQSSQHYSSKNFTPTFIDLSKWQKSLIMLSVNTKTCQLKRVIWHALWSPCHDFKRKLKGLIAYLTYARIPQMQQKYGAHELIITFNKFR